MIREGDGGKPRRKGSSLMMKAAVYKGSAITEEAESDRMVNIPLSFGQNYTKADPQLNPPKTFHTSTMELG